MKTAISIVLAICVAVTGCKSRIDDPVSYTDDISHGLRKKVSMGDIDYDITYKPPAYMVRKEGLSGTAALARMKDLEGTAWFNISFKVRGFKQSPLRYKAGGLENYAARQDYYLNYAARDIYLLYGADTLYVSSYWFENNQNLTLHETMIVGFNLPEGRPLKDMKLSIYDRIFGNGIVKTTILQKDLENLGSLSL